MGIYLCALLASDNTYDYETLSEGYAHQNILTCNIDRISGSHLSGSNIFSFSYILRSISLHTLEHTNSYTSTHAHIIESIFR